MTDDEIKPTLDTRTGVPHCSYEKCPNYDGKRCRALGFRPQGICEPAVIGMDVRLAAVETERDSLRAEVAALLAAKVKVPDRGERCHRCHSREPNPNGCAACNPVRLGVRLTHALVEVDQLRAENAAMQAALSSLHDLLGAGSGHIEARVREVVAERDAAEQRTAEAIAAWLQHLADMAHPCSPSGIVSDLARDVRRGLWRTPTESKEGDRG